MLQSPQEAYYHICQCLLHEMVQSQFMLVNSYFCFEVLLQNSVI